MNKIKSQSHKKLLAAKPKTNKIEIIRHSLAHVLACAVQELYPGTKFGIGPAIENGFYYDFDFNENSKRKAQPARNGYTKGVAGGNSKQQLKIQNLTINDLLRIEKKMREIIKKDLKFEKKEISIKEAKNLFKDQPYKLELIEKLFEKKTTIYQTSYFIDLCKGPHIKSTKEISTDSFKLTKVAGAYWKGDEKNPMLTRIYGIAFENKKDFADYLRQQEEAEKRDHRIFGQKLELFIFDEEIGSGLPIWLPKGTILRQMIQNYLYDELFSAGYQWLATPHIANINLWKTSGHWDFYQENIYSPIEIDNEKYILKPMNCPFHIKVYNSKIRSHRDLPLKYAEFGTVYRYERSGVLHGLTRVRGFTQDDAHIFCAKEQISEEILKLLKQGLKILKTFGFKDFKIYLATRPEKYIGDLKIWQKAENSLKQALLRLKLEYQTDSQGGVFYGPKIDIKIKDCLGREWQCTTIQVDFNLPEKFDINFINQKGGKERAIMIHRALLGSLERFIGVLLEHYAGALPLWLASEQIWIIPIADRHEKYAKEINLQLTTHNLRTKVKDEAETVSKKIREGEMQKIPYLLVVGDKEIESNSVRVRQRGKGDMGEIKINEFIEKIKIEIEKKK